MAGVAAPLQICDFLATQSIFLLSKYWLSFEYPEFIIYPACPECKYSTALQFAWKTGQEGAEEYTKVNHDMFDISSKTITNSKVLRLEHGQNTLPAHLEMSGEVGFVITLYYDFDINRFHSYSAAIKDPLGITWCLNATANNRVERHESLISVPNPPDDCEEETSTVTAINGKVNFNLKNVPLKVGSMTVITLYISSRAADITCAISVSSNMAETKDIQTSGCAFGLLTVSVSPVSQITHKLYTEGSETVPYYLVDCLLQYTGIYASLLIKSAYITVHSIGPHRYPNTGLCKKFNNIGYYSRSFGSKSNIDFENHDIIVTAEGTAETVLTPSTLPASGKKQIFLAYTPPPSGTNRMPLCRCDFQKTALTSDSAPPGGGVSNFKCPTCLWKDNGGTLQLSFRDLGTVEALPRDIYFYLLNDKSRTAWRVNFLKQTPEGETGNLFICICMS